MKNKKMLIVVAVILVVVGLALVGKYADDADHGRGGNYTGKSFVRVFLEDEEDEGVIYKLANTPAIKVWLPVGGEENGYTVEYDYPGNDAWVFVETAGTGYKKGDSLKDGYYIRRGEYEVALTAQDDTVSNVTLARYVEVTHEGTLEKIAQEEQATRSEKNSEAVANKE